MDRCQLWTAQLIYLLQRIQINCRWSREKILPGRVLFCEEFHKSTDMHSWATISLARCEYWQSTRFRETLFQTRRYSDRSPSKSRTGNFFINLFSRHFNLFFALRFGVLKSRKEAVVNKSENAKNLFVEVIMLHWLCEDVVKSSLRYWVYFNRLWPQRLKK